MKDRCDYSRPADVAEAGADGDGDGGDEPTEKKKPGTRKTARPPAQDDAASA